VATRRTWSIIAWIVGFFIAIWLLGFSIAVPLTLVLYLWLAGREKWLTIAGMTFFTWLFFYLLFERTLKVPFPDGLVFSLFKGQ
jgi:Tripartite tricarboxylate transporter TctB family